jgi:Protein of unknown function (DUF3800)
MSDHTFVAYIDESGCDGSKFGDGSSHFLVLSAVVGFDCQKDDIEHQVELVKLASKRAPQKPFPKFEKANPNLKWIMCERFADTPFFAAHVLIHKPSIKSEALRKDRNRLYRYGSKLLVERISWICESLYHPLAGDSKKCRIVFSQDLSRSYTQFRSYMALLHADQAKHSTSIKWDYICPKSIDDLPFRDTAGLLLADYHASALGLAVEKKKFGQFDDRFARILGDKILKSPKGSAFAYGYKFWPEDAEKLYHHDEQFSWMKRV